MRRCEEVVPLLGPLHDGALADDDRAWVEDHSRGCASCRDRLALIAALSQAVRESVVARARGLDLKKLPDRVMARVREERSRAAQRAAVWGRERWWAPRRALAAAGGSRWRPAWPWPASTSRRARAMPPSNRPHTLTRTQWT